MRPSRFLSALAVLAALGCQPSQHSLLLTVHSESDVADVQVTVLSLERRQRHEEPLFRVDRSAEQLAEEPIHIVVNLPQAEQVLVHIDATTPQGEHLYATRCYAGGGIVEDSVLLFGPLGSLDIDGDGFVADPSVICRELDANGSARPCNADDLHICPSAQAGDCVEGDERIHPGARTICLDGIDQDCDGEDEPCGDQDGDGYDACPAVPTGPCDCDDSLESINPGAVDICNDGIDQDCDGADACCDLDGDGYPQCANGRPDCDDADPEVNPSKLEVCDGIDNDCNGLVDELEECRAPDQDGDGFPACGREEPGQPCDCNDCDPTVHPGAREICGNGVSEACPAGEPDASCPAVDADGDGVPPPLDCDDNDPQFFPPQNGREPIERCGDGLANNCIPSDADRGCPDADIDGDGFVEPPGCEGNPAINPDMPEICNNIDDDCDGFIDEGAPSTGDLCLAGSPVTFASDFNNCGGCRVTCARPAGERPGADRCESGTCMCAAGPACAPNEACCQDGCFDLQTSNDNCGACGNPCGRGETCVDGMCTCGSVVAASGADACPDEPGVELNVCCNDTACRQIRGNDASNCGDCNIGCGPSETCSGGACACNTDIGSIASGQVCNGTTCCPSGGCVDTNTDTAHCGGCDRPCMRGEGCSNGTCVPVCGNGVRTPGETCDDGNTLPGDGCSATCQRENGWACSGEPSVCTPVCGDGIIIPGREQCDDGNMASGDGCSSTCVLEPGWTCTGTPTRCTAICGDGLRVGPEACDDGFTTACGVCNANCTGPGTGSTCGDGVRCPDTEVCDDGFTTACGTCNATCTGPGAGSTCGDGVVCPDTEVCDDGNRTACGACNADCTAPGTGSTCGDGVRCPDTEACDDGNRTACGACNADCTGPGTGSTCGDGVVCPDTEFCDDGFTTACGLCNANCTAPGTGSTCGDGVHCPDTEFCDDGQTNACGPCNATCSGAGTPASCGDGVVCAGVEECDDGNTSSGDGCSASCMFEPGWTCTPTSPTQCNICGNGTVEGTEACDDGNALQCGTCNANCSGAGSGNTCPRDTPCRSDDDCANGTCRGGSRTCN